MSDTSYEKQIEERIAEMKANYAEIRIAGHIQRIIDRTKRLLEIFMEHKDVSGYIITLNTLNSVLKLVTPENLPGRTAKRIENEITELNKKIEASGIQPLVDEYIKAQQSKESTPEQTSNQIQETSAPAAECDVIEPPTKMRKARKAHKK